MATNPDITFKVGDTVLVKSYRDQAQLTVAVVLEISAQGWAARVKQDDWEYWIDSCEVVDVKPASSVSRYVR